MRLKGLSSKLTEGNIWLLERYFCIENPQT